MAVIPRWVLEGCRPAVWLLARLYFGIQFRGVEHVPLRGPVLIVPNHVSYADPVLVSIPVHRPVHYMAWEAFFKIPLFGRLIRWLGAFPVRIEEADRRAAREALRLLRGGRAVLIFPEGGRSKDGRPLSFRPGTFRLALAAEATVVPVTIAGIFEAWPASRRFPRPGRVTITYHRPLTASDLPPGSDPKAWPALMAEAARRAVAGALPPAFRPDDLTL